MRISFNKFKKYISPAMMAMILAAVISGFLLFIPPIQGLADNGDFYRAMNSNGVYRLPTHYSQSLDYVITKFGIYQYYNENSAAVFTSQAMIVKFAVFLNKIFYSKTIFDIRFLAIIYYVFFLGAIYLLTKSLVFPYRRIRSYVVALLVVFIFADSSFTLYFNSFFAEPGMYIVMLYSFASILAISRDCYQKRWPMILLFFTSTIMLLTIKQQNAPLALTFAVVAIGLMFLPNFKARRFAILGGIVALLFAGVFTYSKINSEFNDVNQYQSFTHGVLMETGDPSKKLSKAGISPQYSLMRMQEYYPRTYDTVQPSSKYVEKHLIQKTGMGWLIKYYIHNPKQFVRLLDVSTKDIMVTQVKAVGNFTRNSGHKPREHTKYFVLYSTYAGTFFPNKYGFIGLYVLGYTIVYAISCFLDFRAGRYQGVVRFLLVFGMMTIIIFIPIISVLAAGEADLAKHQFIVPITLDLTFILFVSDILHHRLWNTVIKDGDSDEK
jgi:hypothetical protein